MLRQLQKYTLNAFLILFCITGAYSQDKFFTYYNTWCMGTDAQWSMSSAFYLSTKTYAQNLGKTTHVMIFMTNDIVKSNFAPYFSVTKEYVDNGGSPTDSINLLWNGVANPGSGLASWQARGGIEALRDSLHAKGKKIIITLQAVNATIGLNAVITDSIKTEVFTKAVAGYIERHNFDGVDLNTEQGHTFTPEQLTRFFRILRKNMPSPKLITTVPLPTHWDKYKNTIEYIDYVLPQFYAYNQNWQPTPTCNGVGGNGVFLKAPLNRFPNPAGSNHQDLTTWGPVQWYNAGWPKEKIVVLLSNEATPARNVDTLFGCAGTSLPFWPDTAAYAMLSRGGTLVWDSIHIGHYIKGTATSSLTSRGVKIDSGQKFIIPVLSDKNIDYVVAWGKGNGFNNYGLYDISTDARTPNAIKTPRHHHLSSLLDTSATPSISSAFKSVISANPLSIPADSNSTASITVQVKDTGGVNLTKGGDLVVLETTLGSVSSITDNGNGTYSATLRSSKTSGTAIVGGTLNGILFTDTARVIFTPTSVVVNRTGVDIPSQYTLDQNYPNPFNPSTRVTFGLPKSSQVTLKLYDVTGREMTTIVNNYFDAGRYTVTINASSLASGVYLYRLEAGSFIDSKKLILLR